MEAISSQLIAITHIFMWIELECMLILLGSKLVIIMMIALAIDDALI